MNRKTIILTIIGLLLALCSAVPVFPQAGQSPNKERGITALLRALAELNSIAPQERDPAVDNIISAVNQSLADIRADIGYAFPPPSVPPVTSTVPRAGRFLGLDNAATQLNYALGQFRSARPGARPDSLSSSIAKAEQALTLIAMAQAVKDADVSDGKAHNVGRLQGSIQCSVSYQNRPEDIQIQLSITTSTKGQTPDPANIPKSEEWNVSLRLSDGTALELLRRNPVPPARPPGAGNAGTSYAIMSFFFKHPNSGSPDSIEVQFQNQTQVISLKDIRKN